MHILLGKKGIASGNNNNVTKVGTTFKFFECVFGIFFLFLVPTLRLLFGIVVKKIDLYEWSVCFEVLCTKIEFIGLNHKFSHLCC